MSQKQYQYNQTQNLDLQQSNQFQKINKNTHKIRTFQNVMEQLQQKLFNLIIHPFQSQNSNNPSKQTVQRLSKQLHYSLQQTLKDISSLRSKLQIPTLTHQQKQQIKQKILQLSMQQLANNRVLVQTYQHHQYRIIIALFHISKIYQQLNCHPQVINHLTNALEMNQNYLDIKEAFYFHSLLLTYLSNSLCELESYQASLENLNKALEIHQQLAENNIDVNDFSTLHLISKVLSVLKKDQQSITYGKMALQSAQRDYTQNSFQYARALQNLADVSSKAFLFTQSIQYLNKAIQTIQIHTPQKQQTIIQFYTKLTQLTLNKLNITQSLNPQYYQPYLNILLKRYNVIENIYGYRDKRCIKQKRHLASSYLKYNKIQQAENQLQDILEIQMLVYGEKSVEVAKTLKFLGTVAISMNSIKKAEKYLKKSQGIFHDQGFINLQKEVASKLLTITAESKQRFSNK